MFFADYHVHTSFSTDASPGASPEACAERGFALGLDEIAITDHLDFKYRTLEPQPFIDLDEYAARVLRLKDEYAGRISVKFGLELGAYIETAGLSRSVTGKYPFDFIVCSVHDIKGAGIYDGNSFFENKDKGAAHEEYFKEVLSVISARPDFSVFGHLDYLDRYGPYGDKTVRYARHADIVDEILIKLIEEGKGLEVNTSGFRYGLPHTNPKPEFLRRYKELGGEIITLGSDAHTPGHIGADFNKAREMLLSLGFRYAAGYDNMLPRMYPL